MKQIKNGSIILALILSLALLMTPAYPAVASAGVPIITNIYTTDPAVPAAANNGTTTTVFVEGSNLTGTSALTFFIGAASDPLITTSNIILIMDSMIMVDITTAANTVAGPRNVKLTTPSGTSDPLANGFSVYHSTVAISAPGTVSQGGTFWITIGVTNVQNLNGNQFDLIFDNTVIQVTGVEGTLGVTNGVTSGRIPDTGATDNYPQAGWSYQPIVHIPSGQIRVLGHNPGVSTVSGTGYLTRINFRVVGAIGTSSPLTLTGFGMFNSNTSTIVPDSIANSSVTVSGLSITNTSIPDAAIGVPYAGGSLSATGGTAPYTWSWSAAPAGLNLNASTGVISGTPTAAGVYTPTVTVTDSTTPSHIITNKTLSSMTVFSQPGITTLTLPEATDNKTYSATITGAGGKPPYTWNWAAAAGSQLPSGLNIASSGPNTAVISGTPTVSGTPNVVITITDSFAPPNTFSSPPMALHIYPVLQITTSSLPVGVIGNLYTTTLTAGGGKTTYNWTWAAAAGSQLPSGLNLAPLTGVISGTPTLVGDFNLNFMVTDSFSPANTFTTSAPLTLHVSAGATVMTTSLPEANQGKSYTTTLAAVGGTAPYTWAATGLPNGITLDNNTGIISGVPTVSGNFTLAITVTDSSSPHTVGTANLQLHVNPLLQITTVELPRWVVEAYPLNPPTYWLPLPNPGWIVGHAYTATLSGTGGKGAYTWSWSGAPSGLTLDNNTGVISGIPTVTGLFNINVTLTDSIAVSATQLLKLKIYLAGDANGDDDVTIGDVTVVERVILGLNPPTAGCDANANGEISIGDVTKIERIVLGLP